MTTTEISDLWKVISVNTGVTTARRIDAEHPLDFLHHMTKKTECSFC